MKILLIGPQGSGKSTQGKLLAEYLKIPYISTGDIFRQIAQTDARIKQILDAGELVDDETTIKLINDRLTQADGFILDGFPRNLEQAEAINLNFDKVIYLNIPDEVVLKRLLKRGRTDDTEGSIKTRLDLYRAKTQPLLDYYKEQGVLVEVSGEADVRSVQDEIKKFI